MKEEIRKVLLGFCAGGLFITGILSLHYGIQENLFWYKTVGVIFISCMVISLYLAPKLKA